MKTMTCEQLGGACSQTFTAETFDEIAAMSKQHGLDMYHAGDKDHLQAIRDMQASMSTLDEMQNWMKAKRQEFEDMPED